MTWQFTLTGLLIGSLVGMTGMGGGSLMTPILILVFGFQPTLAVGTDILHGAVFKSFGAVRHRQARHRARADRLLDVPRLRADVAGRGRASRAGSRTSTGAASADAMAKVIGWALILGGLGLPREDVHQARSPALERAVPAHEP